jgi:hypothetical protein
VNDFFRLAIAASFLALGVVLLMAIALFAG